jgi:pyridoxamine 5'-phosphate oxidase
VSREDFLARHPKARAAAIAGHQSDPIVDEASALAAATVRLEREPRYVPDDWNAWIVRPASVEFWQAGVDREQVRLRYELADGKWSRQLIWP